MTDWIRKNLVLVAGIVLPVLLVVGFMLLQGFNSVVSESPRYDFLVAGYVYDPNSPPDFNVSFEVRSGRLQGIARPRGNPPERDNQRPVLYRYSVAEHRFIPIDWLPPEDFDVPEGTRRFAIEAVAGLELDAASVSPDGFVLQWLGYRGGGGLLGELFGFGRRYENYWALKHGDALFELPPFSPRQYFAQHQLQFLGWVTAETAAP